jgi:hypothetical protein
MRTPEMMKSTEQVAGAYAGLPKFKALTLLHALEDQG